MYGIFIIIKFLQSSLIICLDVVSSMTYNYTEMSCINASQRFDVCLLSLSGNCWDNDNAVSH